MKKNKVIFAGAGPGATDLITIRCMNAIKNADLIIYAGSLVNPEILKYAKNNCIKIDSSKLSLNEIICEIRKAYEKNLKVLRLHTGDPAIYGAIAEQMLELDKLKIPYEIIPGVSSVFAAAAALKTELTTPEISQTIILTRTSGKTPVPHGQELQNLARHKATIALFLSTPLAEKIQDELIRGGYNKNTPVAIVYKASWKDQKIIRTSVANLAKKMKDSNITRQSIIFIGDALDKKNWHKSKLYDPSFSHAFRNAKNELKNSFNLKYLFNGSCAIYCLTNDALQTALKIQNAKPDFAIFANKKLLNSTQNHEKIYPISENSLGKTISSNWEKFNGHIFIMATGIVVRYIAPLLNNKTKDPAVVVCDQNGNFAISLLSGHLGGANRLASDIASILGGQEVITTATDCAGLIAFDEMATQENLSILNPDAIKVLNFALLEGKKIAANIPKKIFCKYYSQNQSIKYIRNPSKIDESKFHALITTKSQEEIKTSIPTLFLKENL